MTTNIAFRLGSFQSTLLVDKLSNLFSYYLKLYRNITGYRLKIIGSKFHELHLYLEELCKELIIKMDIISKRIHDLDETHMYDYHRTNPKIIKSSELNNPKKIMASILESFVATIEIQRDILTYSEKTGDHEMRAMMRNYIVDQENKMELVYKAYIS